MNVVFEYSIRQHEDEVAAELVFSAGVQIQHVPAGAFQAIDLIQFLTHIL